MHHYSRCPQKGFFCRNCREEVPFEPADIVLGDPPWWYNNRKTGGERKDKTKFGGGAQKHYPLLKAHEIIDPAITFDFNAIAKDKCLLFLWVTMPLLYDLKRRRPTWKPTEKWKAPHDVLTVLQGWGMEEYCTAPFVWVKTTKNGKRFRKMPGFYTASNAEMVLLARRGGGWQPLEKMLDQIISTPWMGHSVKPDIHPMIDRMYPDKRKLEIFARREYPGWHAWGDQAPNSIVLPKIEPVTADIIRLPKRVSKTAVHA